MEAPTRERFPAPEELVAERFGDVDKDKLCPKCGRIVTDDTHYPDFLGGGCMPKITKACPECGESGRCAEWCSIARLR